MVETPDQFIGQRFSGDPRYDAREIFSHPGMYTLEVGQIREVLAVMRRLGLAVVNLPGAPLRLLVTLMSALPPSISRPVLGLSQPWTGTKNAFSAH